MKYKIYNLLNAMIALVWLANGLFCKVLNLVPRHQQIVARILGISNSSSITFVIGIAEILMCVLILLRFRSKQIAVLQILIITVMNTIEFFTVPDLLLWGKLNSLFALIFIFIIYYSNFVLNKKSVI